MMKIEVSNKIELQIGEHTVAMTMLEVRSLIKRLQEVIGESDPPRLTSTCTYPPGVRGYSVDGRDHPPGVRGYPLDGRDRQSD